jgi:hypothetical protein
MQIHTTGWNYNEVDEGNIDDNEDQGRILQDLAYGGDECPPVNSPSKSFHKVVFWCYVASVCV